MRVIDLFETQQAGEIDLDEAVEFYVNNCKTWNNVSKPLWRFLEDTVAEPFEIKLPRKRYSDSKGDSQQMQDYLFSLPSWEKFPKRNMSVFCSTGKSSHISDDQEIMVAIYPIDGTLLGVTDGWKDFNDLEWAPKLRLQDSSILFAILLSLTGQNTIEGLVDYAQNDFDPQTFSELKIKDAFLSHFMGKYDSQLKDAMVYIKNSYPPTPKDFKCSVKTIPELKLSSFESNKEVWFSNTYLRVDYKDGNFEKFVNAVRQHKSG